MKSSKRLLIVFISIALLILLIGGCINFAADNGAGGLLKGLVAHFTFDSADGGITKDTVKGIEGKVCKAVLTDGKYGKAADFNGKDSYIKVDRTIASMNTMTLSLWARYRDVNNEFNSLLHCDGWQTNAFHLSVKGDGSLHSGVYGNLPDDAGVSKPGLFTADMMGKWQHYAIIYDSTAGRIAWYVNGKNVFNAKLDSADGVKLGPLDFGAWDMDGVISRYMNGSIDEVLIYDRALSAEEINLLASATTALDSGSADNSGTAATSAAAASAGPTPIPGMETSYYVSVKGDDKNPGTLELPFATVARARDAVREAFPEKMTGNIIVYIRGGDYYLSKPLEFNLNDSGKDGFKVYYRNYPGEQPYIHGGTLLTGWTKDRENIYKVSLEAGAKPSAFYENGVRAVMARYPNAGYSIADGAKPLSKTQFKYRNNDIPAVDHPGDMEIQIWAGGDEGIWNWFRQQEKPASIDTATKTVTLSNPVYYNLGTGSRYFVQNQYAFLDQAGEFYVDAKSSPSVAYYWPRSEDVKDLAVLKPYSNGPVISVIGDSASKPAHDIVFQGLVIGETDRGRAGIYLNYSSNITIDKCVVRNTGDSGISMVGANTGNTVSNCSIYDTGYCGVSIEGPYNPVTVDLVNHNTVTNCHIYQVGQIVGHGSGVDIENSSYNTISYNLIHDCPKSGILISGPQPKDVLGKTIEGVVGTEDNYRKFTHCDHNVIEYNDVSGCMYDTQDNGPVYIFCADYTTIRNNSIHDCDIVGAPGNGIYLDGHSDDTLVQKNLIYNLQQKGGNFLRGIIAITGFRDTITNNYVVNNKLSGHASGSFIHTAVYKDKTDFVVTKNIFYTEKGDIANWEAWTPNSTVKTFDYNDYFNKTGQYQVFGCKTPTFEAWKASDNKKYDQHSITQDPIFMDMAANDFRLRYDSPAYKLGVEDLDLQNIGLKSDFVFADPKEVLGVIYVRKSGDNADRATIDLGKGSTTKLSVTGRTASGYAADLSQAVIGYKSDKNAIAAVSSEGVITAAGTGVAKITVEVVKDGVKKSKDIYVRIP